jgi:hypothetical protein
MFAYYYFVGLIKVLISVLLVQFHRLIGSRIIESAAYCNQKLLAHLYLNSKQNTSVIVSFGYCYHF